MHSSTTNGKTKVRLNISAVALKFGSTKLTAAAIRGASTMAVLFALLLIAATMQAQTETVLYNFCSQPSCADGARVVNLGGLTSYGGNFYGMTQSGGAFGRWNGIRAFSERQRDRSL
jgi:hypothetical protein